jgi:branched-subunit amino acid transport protein
MAVTASAARRTLPPVLKALTVFLQASALNALAARFIFLRRAYPASSKLAVLAASAAARFAARLTGAIALAVFGLAVGLDAAAAYPPLGGESFEEVVDLAVF